MSAPDYWGRCDTCGEPLTEVGRVAVYSAGAGTLRFRFCDGDCKDRFQNRDVHAEFDRGELVTDGGTEASGSYRRIARGDREAWENASRGDMAGKWSVWCADCGAKNHKNASECSRCGYGDGPGTFGVGNKWNVGRAKYTSDGERGRYLRTDSEREVDPQ